MALDTTERDRAERATARLAAIVNSSDEAIVGKTLDGVITSWNPAAERTFGYTAVEALGRNIRLIIPEDRHAEEEGVLARIRRGEEVDQFETERLTADGRTIIVSLKVSPIRGPDGKLVGASKIARDITEKKRNEEKLVGSQHYLQAVLDSMPECVKVLGPDGAVLQARVNTRDLEIRREDIAWVRTEQTKAFAVEELVPELLVLQRRNSDETNFRLAKVSWS